MALKIGDRLTLRATVAELTPIGGEHNVCLEANGHRLWVTESRLAAFIADGERASGLALDVHDLGDDAEDTAMRAKGPKKPLAPKPAAKPKPPQAPTAPTKPR